MDKNKNHDEDVSFINGNHSEQKLAEASKIKWSSRTEFIISLLGYSIGIADIWRVPYITYRNGGGAFLIPYIFFMIVCGIPLYFLEIMLSQYSGKGCWRIWDICPLFRGFGLAFFVINWVVGAYLMIQKPWMMEYIIASFHSVLPWSTCNNEWNTPGCITISLNNNTTSVMNSSLHITDQNNITTTPVSVIVNGTSYLRQSSVEEFWKSKPYLAGRYETSVLKLFTNLFPLDKVLCDNNDSIYLVCFGAFYKVPDISSGIHEFGTLNWKYLLYLVVIHVIVWLSLMKSVQSIGKMMYVTAILPVLFTIIIWIRALTLSGSMEGMMYFIKPDFERLGNVQVWIEAAFMAFTTLGPAWGGLTMYGSHNRFHDNCFRDSIITTLLTMSYGLLNGLVIFAVIGVLAKQSNIPIDEIITSGGFSLVFVAYPQAVTFFPMPQVWAVLFFIILILPGIDGQTILMEPVLCIIEENFPTTIGKRRKPLLTGCLLITFVVGIPLTSQAGVYIVQLIDWYCGTWSVLLIAVMETILFSWIYGGDRLARDVQMMLGRDLPVLVRVSCAFVTPIILLFLVIISIFKYKPPTYGSYTYSSAAIGVGWGFAMASIVPIFVWMIIAVIREEGSILQRLKRLLSPNKFWRPTEKEFQTAYDLSEEAYKRSAERLLIFNLLGKGKLDTPSEHQLT